MPSAERRQGADGDRGLAECQPGDDGRAAPGGDQGQDGGELHADVAGRDGDAGLGREPLQGAVAGGAGRPGHPRPAGEVTQAADRALPVWRGDQEVGVEGQLAQAEARLGGRGARGVVLGEHDVQVAETQGCHGVRPVAFGEVGRIAGMGGREVRRAGVISGLMTLWKAAIRTGPAAWPVSSARSRSAWRSCAAMRSPCPASSRPAAVSVTCRPVRSMRLAPVSRSRASSCWETAGGVRCSAWRRLPRCRARRPPAARAACGVDHPEVSLSLYGR